MFMSDQHVLPPNNVSEQALCMSTVFRKVTNRVRVERGAELYCGVWTVVATVPAGVQGAGRVAHDAGGRQLLAQPTAASAE